MTKLQKIPRPTTFITHELRGAPPFTKGDFRYTPYVLKFTTISFYANFIIVNFLNISIMIKYMVIIVLINYILVIQRSIIALPVLFLTIIASIILILPAVVLIFKTIFTKIKSLFFSNKKQSKF